MTLQKLVNGIRRMWVVLLITGVLLIGVLIILTPQNISNIASSSHPVQSYAEAMQRIETLRAQEPQAMNPVCQLQLLTHEKKVERAIILVHGYTNCPQQFSELGQRFFDLGYNVLLVPMPHHGLADRMTETQAQLTAEELSAYANETVDIAQGLGEKVTMLGISVGGATTAWAAQNRSDLDLAVIISPLFGFKQVPTPLTAAIMNIYSFLPDSFEWWDPVKQADAPPAYAYPRYSKHALVQTLRLGFAMQAAAQHQPPAAKKIIVVFNANDNSVNNELTMEIVKIWQAHNANLTTDEFDANLKLGHDLIDPSQPDQKIDLVYPRLIDLVGQ
jgi:pimeloyl-ACP methyl ester carboxylesterase